MPWAVGEEATPLFEGSPTLGFLPLLECRKSHPQCVQLGVEIWAGVNTCVPKAIRLRLSSSPELQFAVEPNSGLRDQRAVGWADILADVGLDQAINVEDASNQSAGNA